VSSPHAAPARWGGGCDRDGRATAFRACRDHRQAARLHRRPAACWRCSCWPGSTSTTPADALVERLTGRFVVRYDLRDTGRSTTVDPDLPGYTLRDLVTDAVGVLDGLGIACAHLAGLAPAASSRSS